MTLTITPTERDSLYEFVADELSGIGDISTALWNDQPEDARRLRRRFEADMRLLDDLGWQRQSDRSTFALTLPHDELTGSLHRLDLAALGGLMYVDEYGSELKPEQRLRRACSTCATLLSRLAELEDAARDQTAAR